MEHYESHLQKAGLTGNEAKVYLELLKKGSLSANNLSKNISIDRTLSYTILNNLIEKGLVNYIVKSNKKLFSPSSPENLLNSIKKKELFIKELIPNLKNIKKVKEESNEIKIYEGKEGLRTFVNLILKEKEYYAFGATGRTFHLLYEIPMITKKLKKSNINAKIIGNIRYKGTKPFTIKHLKFKYLDLKSDATTSIFGNYVSIHLLTKKPLVILIKNKEIAESYKNHFNLLWKIAKK